jgi:hypothetical protein
MEIMSAPRAPRERDDQGGAAGPRRAARIGGGVSGHEPPQRWGGRRYVRDELPELVAAKFPVNASRQASPATPWGATAPGPSRSRTPPGTGPCRRSRPSANHAIGLGPAPVRGVPRPRRVHVGRARRCCASAPRGAGPRPRRVAHGVGVPDATGLRPQLLLRGERKGVPVKCLPLTHASRPRNVGVRCSEQSRGWLMIYLCILCSRWGGG